jgi:hypothetical protein
MNMNTLVPRAGGNPIKRGGIYDQITERIIAMLANGTVPWRKLWKTQSGFPRNLVSGKKYRGLNVFLIHAMSYESPYWLPVALYFSPDGRTSRLIKLIATCGPLDMDDPQPAITIMPDED